MGVSGSSGREELLLTGGGTMYLPRQHIAQESRYLPSATYFNDVWSSEDGGATWRQVMQDGAAPWTRRWGHQLLTGPALHLPLAEDREEVLYLIGGNRIYDNFTVDIYADVWIGTSDWRSWELVSASAEFGKRIDFRALALPGCSSKGHHQLAVFGGFYTPSSSK